MKTFKYFVAIIGCLTLTAVSVHAQSSKNEAALDAELQARIAKNTVPGAQLGMLICENAEGKMAICSGNTEETVLGIATNVPYVTLNKPDGSNASRYIFSAFVSGENGAIDKGVLLKAGKGGNLVLCSSEHSRQAYAVALEDFRGSNGRIRVKLLPH